MSIGDLLLFFHSLFRFRSPYLVFFFFRSYCYSLPYSCHVTPIHPSNTCHRDPQSCNSVHHIQHGCPRRMKSFYMAGHSTSWSYRECQGLRIPSICKERYRSIVTNTLHYWLTVNNPLKQFRCTCFVGLITNIMYWRSGIPGSNLGNTLLWVFRGDLSLSKESCKNSKPLRPSFFWDDM